MNKKKIIIIIVFAIIIIAFLLYSKKGNSDETGNESGSGTSSGTGSAEQFTVTTDKNDPNGKPTKPQSWYDQRAADLIVLADGYTNAADERQIINIISSCKTDQDVFNLEKAYGTDERGYTLRSMVVDELDEDQIAELNRNLRNNGCISSNF